MTDTDDRAQILAHIDSIFAAYLRRDRARIRDLHTADWVGFQGPSVAIERGLDAYMVNADHSLEALEGRSYDIVDTEVQLLGDVALVYYVARYHARDRNNGAPVTVSLRALDVYRREGAGWNQCGSHITPVPARPSWQA